MSLSHPGGPQDIYFFILCTLVALRIVVAVAYTMLSFLTASVLVQPAVSKVNFQFAR